MKSWMVHDCGRTFQMHFILNTCITVIIHFVFYFYLPFFFCCCCSACSFLLFQLDVPFHNSVLSSNPSFASSLPHWCFSIFFSPSFCLRSIWLNCYCRLNKIAKMLFFSEWVKKYKKVKFTANGVLNIFLRLLLSIMFSTCSNWNIRNLWLKFFVLFFFFTN